MPPTRSASPAKRKPSRRHVTTPPAAVEAADPPAPESPANTAGREVELTFQLDEAAFKAARQSPLLGAPQRARTVRLQATCFDTEGRHLARHGMVLRVRDEQGARTMTLEATAASAANPFLRQAFETPVEGTVPDLALFGPELAAELAELTHGEPLRPAHFTDIRRVVHRVAFGHSRIHVAFDTGTIGCDQAREPVREIELELASGDPADLFGFGLAMLDAVPARLGILSKGERGVLLSTGARPASVRATTPLAPGHSVDAAIGEVIGACIKQFIANWPAFEAAEGPEPVHQMRVAMRRLRAALALFRRSFHCVELEAFRNEAKDIASTMGEARNWDVFVEMLRAGPQAMFPDDEGFRTLLAACETHRAAGYQAVEQLLLAPATSRFVLSVLALVERHGWRNGVAGPDLPRLTAPATGFAAQHLERLRRRVRKRGRNLLELPPEQRHEARIALKNLRYATDFFGVLFEDAPAVRAYARAAARLQDVLGSFNDMATASDLLRRLNLDDDIAAVRAAGIVLGWHGRAGLTDRAALDKAWRAFRKAKPFWTEALEPEANRI